MSEFPTAFQRRVLWRAATGIAILVLGLLIIGLIWFTGKLFGFLQPVLIPLMVAGIVAYLLDPVVGFLERRGIGRLGAVLGVYAALLAGITLMLAAVLPGIQRGHGKLRELLREPNQQTSPAAPIVRSPEASEDDEVDHSEQLGTALERQLRRIEESHRHNMLGWILIETDDAGNPIEREETAPPRTLDSFARSRGGRMIFEYKGAILRTARDWVMAGSSRVLGFLGFLIGMLMVPVYLFFFLKDSASIRARWHDYVPIRASRFKTELVSTLQEINGYLISFFRGQVLVAGIDGVLVGIALTIFGLPYGLIIGIFMAVLGIVPYIGSILCLIPACLIGWLHAQVTAPFGMGPWTYVGCIVAIFVIVQQINSLVTAPKIVGDSVGLHPLTVIFSILLWSFVLGGFVGALVAIPLSAAIKVLFRRLIWEPRMRDLVIVTDPNG
jgi:predicted PurR-regulated permease PerM